MDDETGMAFVKFADVKNIPDTFNLGSHIRVYGIPAILNKEKWIVVDRVFCLTEKIETEVNFSIPV